MSKQTNKYVSDDDHFTFEIISAKEGGTELLIVTVEGKKYMLMDDDIEDFTIWFEENSR